MQRNIDRVLISHHQIAERVNQLARQITADHRPSHMTDVESLTVIPILTGAMIFCCDLMRQIPLPIQLGFLTVSSYPGNSIRSQGAALLSQQLGDLRGQHVLLIDDILDSGGTLKLVLPMLHAMQPASIKTCVLLRKKRPCSSDIHPDYIGFDIPDEFVVGYGLDFENYYRNLPDIVTLKPEIIQGVNPSAAPRMINS